MVSLSLFECTTYISGLPERASMCMMDMYRIFHSVPQK